MAQSDGSAYLTKRWLLGILVAAFITLAGKWISSVEDLKAQVAEIETSQATINATVITKLTSIEKQVDKIAEVLNVR